MKLFQRMNDIICANIHDMIDRFENPEVMLKQAIREMEQSIETVTSETAKAMAGEKRLARELAKNEVEAQQWHQRALQAVENADDQLARKALTRKNECQSLSLAIREQHEAVSKAVEALKQQLAAMKAKLAEAQRHLGGLLIRKKSADIRKQAMTSLDPKLSAPLGTSAFRKFDRLREKVEEAEAQAEALSELSSIGALSLCDLDGSEKTVSLDNRFVLLDVEEQLKQLKSRKQ